MSHYALWVDHQDAYVYKFGQQGIDEMKLKAPAHHSGSRQNYEEFYHEIANELGDAQELVVMGPGVAKDEFKHHCEKHHHDKLAKAIVGVRSMESHPTKAMIKEQAQDFFKHYHMWTKNY